MDLIEEGDNGVRCLFGRHGKHAAKVQRAFTQEAGTAFRLMAEDDARWRAGTS
jgi:hypothetical protein